jgi:hypothetical protein
MRRPARRGTEAVRSSHLQPAEKVAEVQPVVATLPTTSLGMIALAIAFGPITSRLRISRILTLRSHTSTLARFRSNLITPTTLT